VLALTSRSNDSWLVMGYDDHKSLELDLPGGKRHLGETSLEGAIRETEEETSLVWDASWVTTALQSKKRSEGGNRYFVLHPPQSLLDHQTDDH
jgi:8-oxo-dGTP pyrophosphatase MutT (NUDIX family)